MNSTLFRDVKHLQGEVNYLALNQAKPGCSFKTYATGSSYSLTANGLPCNFLQL